MEPKITVFAGNQLNEHPPSLPPSEPLCTVNGKTNSGALVTLPFDESLLSKHIIFLGSIGTGKTNGIFQFVDQLQSRMTPSDVMVIFDSKGDFHETFSRPNDLVIANDEKASGNVNAELFWNLFCEIEEGTGQEESILEIARALFFEKTEASTQPFFPNAARDIFAGLLIHFSRQGESAAMNNHALRSFLDQASGEDIRKLLQQHQDLRAMVNYIANDKSPQTQGVLSELQQLVREIFVGNFRRPGNLGLRQAIRQKGGRTIFIEYDLGLGATLTPIYRLMMDMAIKESLSRKKSEGNVWFIIDEFRLTPNLQHIDNGVNFGRSLGAKFIIGVQNVEQIYHTYGEPLARSMLAGFSTMVAFRVNDHATREYIQQLFGRNRKREVYMATVHNRGVIEQIRDANVVEDWDISNLGLGEAIIGLPGIPPFRFQFDRFESAR